MHGLECLVRKSSPIRRLFVRQYRTYPRAWQMDSVCLRTSGFFGARPSFRDWAMLNIDGRRLARASRWVSGKGCFIPCHQLIQIHVDVAQRSCDALGVAFTSFMCSNNSFIRLLSMTWPQHHAAHEASQPLQSWF